MKAIVQKASLFILSALISLLFLELLIRLFIPQQLIILRPDIWRPDDKLGYRHVENANTIVNAGEGTVHFVTDQHGYRINQTGLSEKIEPDISILVLGDSFLEAIQVENELTIPEVIRRHLEAKYGESVQVDNTAVGGWDPNHYYLEAKKALLQKHYDLGIVFLYSANDIIGEEIDSFPPKHVGEIHSIRLPRNITRDEIINSVLYPINDYLERRSHLFVLLKVTGEEQLARFGLTAYYFPRVFEIQEATSPDWATTAIVNKKIQNEFDNYHTPVFFVLLPTPYQVNDQIFAKYIKMFGIDPTTVNLVQPNERLQAEFESRGLELIDPLDHMRLMSNEGLELYGSVDRHFNEHGHQVVAEYILPLIESRLNRVNTP